jgi:hypothetical protein
MNVRRKSRKFKLIEINGFDARCGYKRCTPIGVGTIVERVKANADFWTDRKGQLVVRFSSQGYNYHFKGLLASGKHIPEDKMDDFGEYVSEMLCEWLIEGVDDCPEFICET